MKVKLLKDYEGHKKGDVIDVEDVQVSTLKIRAIAEKALDEKAEKAKEAEVKKQKARVARKEKNSKAGPNAPKKKSK